MRLIWDQFHLLWERILFVCLFVCPKDSRLCLAPLLMLLIAQVSILLFTPYFSKIILNLQLQPQEFVTGSLIKCIYFCRLVEKTVGFTKFICGCLLNYQAIIVVLTGLAIFCCMPTTLSSGVALTQVC